MPCWRAPFAFLSLALRNRHLFIPWCLPSATTNYTALEGEVRVFRVTVEAVTWACDGRAGGHGRETERGCFWRASVSSGPPPHIQSLTLFIQRIPLKSNQEKYSLFVRFARQRGRSLPQPRRDQRSLKAPEDKKTSPVKGLFVPHTKQWGVSETVSESRLQIRFYARSKPIVMIHFGLCMCTQTQKPEQIQILQLLEEDKLHSEPGVRLLILDTVCVDQGKRSKVT